jgi:beta-D-xylosidase 4
MSPCSYNAINGVHSCASSWLLKTVAREAWNFDGYVTAVSHI